MSIRPVAFVAVFLAAALALSSCSTSPSSSANGEDAITFLSPFSKEITQPLVEKFEDSHPGVTVKTSYTAENSQQLLVTQLSAGTAPDVMYMNPGSGAPTAVGVLAEKGYLADLSDSPWADKIPDEYKPLLSHDGKVYAFPSTIFGVGAIYNKTALDEAQLEAPTTWDEVLSFCSAAKSKGLTAFSAALNEGWIAQLIGYSLVSTLVDRADPSFNSKVGESASFADSKWLDALTKYKELGDSNCFQPNATGTDGDASMKSVAQGDVLAVVSISAVLSSITDYADEGTEFELLPLPATNDVADTAMPASLASTMGVNAKAKNPKLARTFVDWMSEPAQLASIADGQAGSLPTIADSTFEAPAFLSTFEQFSQEGRTTTVPDSEWPNAQIQATYIAGVQAMFLGTMTPLQVVQSMDEAAKQ